MLGKEELVSEIYAAAGKSDLWAGRAVGLVEVMNGTALDVFSDTLLDDMLLCREDCPELATFLETLPGLATGDKATAARQLHYLTIQVRAAITALNERTKHRA